MSPRELAVWQLYREKYGPMTPIRKYDAGPALIASEVNRMRGGKASAYDFMIYAPKREENPDDVVKLLMADPKIKKGR